MIIYDPEITGSFRINGQPVSSLSSIDSISGSVAVLENKTLVSSSNQLAGQTIDGDLTITGKLTAQEYHTELVSASIIYESGSTKFGDTIDDVHDFTGSLQVSGSTHYLLGNVGIGTTTPTFATIDTYNQRGIHIAGSKGSGTSPVIRLSEGGSGKGDFEIRSNREGLTSGNMLQFGEAADTFMVIRGDDDDGGTATRGFVGIGTTSPDEALTVGTGGKIKVLRTDNTRGGDFYTDNDGVHLRSLGISNDPLFISALNNGGIRFETAGGERMRIDSSGNVGIGTTNPYNALTIEGSTSRLDLNNAGGASRKALLIEPLGYGGNAYARIESYDYGTSTGGILTLNALGGNVGIGTTSPSAKLDIAGKTIVGSDASNALEVFSSGDTEIGFSYATKGNVYAKIIGDITQASPLGGEIAFQTATGGTLTERMRIDSSGNVGIGTSSPSQLLHIENGLSLFSANQGGGGGTPVVIRGTNGVGGGGRTFGLKFDGVSNDTGPVYSTFARILVAKTNGTQGNTQGTLYFDTNRGAGLVNAMVINSSGNVGIGTTSPTSGYRLDVVGGGLRIFGPNATGTFFTAQNDGASGALFQRVNASSYPYNQFNFYNGRVGIGSITPAYPLHVEAESGGSQVYLSRVNAYARVYMGGTDSTASQLYIDAGGLGGVRLDYNTTSWTSASDIRLKNISSEISGTLNKLENIRAVNFSWKNDEENKNNYGVIAQEVEAEFPELVSESSIDNMKGVKYTEFVPILISAIKELKAEIDTLKQQISN